MIKNKVITNFSFFLFLTYIFKNIEKGMIKMKEKIVHYSDIDESLGGFLDLYSEDEDIFDSINYNQFLAVEYLDNMYNENFEYLGYLSYGLLKNINDWIEWSKEKRITPIALMDGSFFTKNNRTFIEAITARCAYRAGEAYYEGNCDRKFIAMMVAFGEGINYLMYANHSELSEIEYRKFICDVFVELDKIYLNTIDQDKIDLLRKTKQCISRVPKKFCKKIKLPKHEFTKRLFKS